MDNLDELLDSNIKVMECETEEEKLLYAREVDHLPNGNLRYYFPEKEMYIDVHPDQNYLHNLYVTPSMAYTLAESRELASRNRNKV